MYSPLIGSSLVELPNELNNPKKGLINIKNSDNKCFLWCHVRHFNLIKKYPDRINKQDERLANNLNYEGIEFPIAKNDYCKIEKQKIFVLTCFVRKQNYLSALHIWRNI